MPHTTIPNWTAQGVLPPANPLNPTGVADRSPYKINIVDLILHFGTTEKRCTILQGFLRFRHRLHQLGLVNGFQWLDGSFMENVETLENRFPNDLDVVTFVHFPTGTDQKQIIQQEPLLVDRQQLKTIYHIDHFFVQLSEAPPEYLVERSRYWYSVWSHRRAGDWKGYVEVKLNPEHDAVALKNLTAENTSKEQTV